VKKTLFQFSMLYRDKDFNC